MDEPALDHPVGVPLDLPIIERTAVRVVLTDASGAVLLFHTREPALPAFGTWWELPGGGLEAGESYQDAAIREVREETGFILEPAQVEQPRWRWRACYRYEEVRRLQDEVAVLARLPLVCPDVDESGRLDSELACYFGYRWWPVHELASSQERFYPRRLPALLPAFLSGQVLDEPFEFWS